MLNLRPFQFPKLCQWRGAQEARREHGQDSRPELAKGTFHTTECHAQHINKAVDWGLLITAWGWADVTCFSWVLFLSLFLFINYYYYHHNLHYFQLLNCCYLKPWILPFISNSPPHWREGDRVSEQLHGTYLMAGGKWQQQCSTKLFIEGGLNLKLTN